MPDEDMGTVKLLTLAVSAFALCVSVASAAFAWRTSQSSLKSNDFKIVIEFNKELSGKWKSFGAVWGRYNSEPNRGPPTDEVVFEFGELVNYIETLAGILNRRGLPDSAATDLSEILLGQIEHILKDEVFVNIYAALREKHDSFKHIEDFCATYGKTLRPRAQYELLVAAVRTQTQLVQ